MNKQVLRILETNVHVCTHTLTESHEYTNPHAHVCTPTHTHIYIVTCAPTHTQLSVPLLLLPEQPSNSPRVLLLSYSSGAEDGWPGQRPGLNQHIKSIQNRK